MGGKPLWGQTRAWRQVVSVGGTVLGSRAEIVGKVSEVSFWRFLVGPHGPDRHTRHQRFKRSGGGRLLRRLLGLVALGLSSARLLVAQPTPGGWRHASCQAGPPVSDLVELLFLPLLLLVVSSS